MGGENAQPYHPLHHQQRPHQQEAVTTDDQRARITGHFKVAKPLLACKRPRNFAPLHSPRNGGAVWTKPPTQAAPLRRAPLMELRTNSFSPDPVRYASKFVEPEIGCKGEVIASMEQQVDVHSFGDSSMLDEDFDEEVLREIDAICEQRSSAKRERRSSVGDCKSSVGITLSCGEIFLEDGNVSEQWRMQQSEEERVNIPQHGNGNCPSSVSMTSASSEIFPKDGKKSVKQSEEEMANIPRDGNGNCPSNVSITLTSGEIFPEDGKKSVKQSGEDKVNVPQHGNGNCPSIGIVTSTSGEIFAEDGKKSVNQSEEERVNVPQHGNGNCPFSVTMTSTSGEILPEDGKKSVKQSEEERVNVPQDVAGTDGSMPQAYLGYLQSLNDRQREAACCDISVPLMIAAGPGSGKTSTMVGRVLTLLKEGISPTNILAMTFTTAAAAEMRDRIATVTGKAVAKEIPISTFHSFCLQLCRSHAEKLDRTSEFLIYGHGQQRRAVIEALRLLENEKGQTSVKCSGTVNAESFKEKSKKWQKFVTQAKAAGRTPELCQKMGDEMGAAILCNYDNILRSCNALDYHDFISCSVRLLTEFPEVSKDCQDSWKAIVVDEFQDTSSMQYSLLRVLASHNHITIIGDEDQSIFSFNGADVCGFDSFRRDYPGYKEVQLCKNYRSTRCIVEAASFVIRNNVKRCQQKEVVSENSSGCKITIKECDTEDIQCAFVVDKILEGTSDSSFSKSSFNNVAILYRRQVTGRAFQVSFRDRKIPFNNHGVAFYRKKVIKAIIGILRTTLPGCGDSPFRQAFKMLFSGEKDEKKKIIDHIEKISAVRNCSFISAASDIFGAKISGTFKRVQLTQGRKVLSVLDMLSKLVCRERSISAVISSAVNVLPQKHLFEQRAVVDVDGGKYLNEDYDLRSVLQYVLDDVAEFLSMHFSKGEGGKVIAVEENGCRNVLCAFLDHISLRETEHFKSLRCENKNSVTLTTIHQSKGLEWDTVFIVKANESEIPLLHEYNGITEEAGTTLEEERRLLYVAMTRARKKLYILYVLMDSNRQPSRFLREIPVHLVEFQVDVNKTKLLKVHEKHLEGTVNSAADLSKCLPFREKVHNPSLCIQDTEDISDNSTELVETCLGNNFLKRFSVEDRSTVSHLFHQWARKQAFQTPRRLIDKVGFVIDERLRNKTSKNKDLLRSLKASLSDDECFKYAQYVLSWEDIPLEKRTHLMRQKQDHFQKQRIENSMSSSAATSKQINYLQSLGCTIVPTSRLHASRLIEQYKSL